MKFDNNNNLDNMYMDVTKNVAQNKWLRNKDKDPIFVNLNDITNMMSVSCLCYYTCVASSFKHVQLQPIQFMLLLCHFHLRLSVTYFLSFYLLKIHHYLQQGTTKQ